MRAVPLLAVLVLASCALTGDDAARPPLPPRGDAESAPPRPADAVEAPVPVTGAVARPEGASAGTVTVAATLFDDRLPPRPPAVEHTPAPWPFDVKHYHLDLDLHPAERRIAGSVTIDLEDAGDALTELPLDAVGLEILRVTERDAEDAARPARIVGEPRFSYDGRTLRIPLAEPRYFGRKRRFEVEYAGRPVRGIYFNEGEPAQVYTQGEMEDSRYWFPCHDFPDDRATHSMRVDVEGSWDFVTAGASTPADLDGDSVPASAVESRIEVPHVSYLTTLVAGDYEVIEERGVVPLLYVVEKRDAPYAAANFRKTDAVLRFLGEVTGLPYPYPKYAQTCVRHFMWGGMENISATTLTDATIHPPEWEPAHSSTSLVAHEAAHQWFGNWITCADWSHNWLNEGFASYFDLLFTERDEGRDAFLWRLRGERHGALGAMDHERRAVVSNRWADPADHFDGHAYAGGAVRLHMLRHLLGDKEFFGAIRHYVTKCGLSCVTTDDFRAVVEEYTGRDLGWFFDQWFHRPGYPVLKVRWEWDASRSAARVTVEQNHKAEGGAPEAYRLPLDVGFVFGSETLTRRVEVTKRSETFEVPLPAQPRHVRPDPETALLARFDTGYEMPQWAFDVFFAENVAWRMDAADTIAAFVKDPKNTPDRTDSAYATLVASFRSADNGGPPRYAPFRAALAPLVAVRRTDVARDALVEAATSDPDLRVRLAALDALHGFEKDPKALDALVLHLADPHDLVRASAVAGVAKLKHPLAFETMLAAADRPGWHSVARSAALRGLADLGDARALPTLARHAAPGDPWARGAAFDALGRLGKGRPEFRDAVLPFLDDPVRDVRRHAADALGKMGDESVIPVLCARFQVETWPAVKDALREAVKACRAAAVVEGRLTTVEAVRAHELRERHAPLRDERDRVATALTSLTGAAKTDAETRLASLKSQVAQLERDLGELGVPVKPKPASK